MDINIPGINSKRGIELCDGDTEMYIRFLALYVSNVPPPLESMRKVSEETLRSYVLCVHGVKSNCEIIGAEEAGEMAKQLEATAKAGDLAWVLAHNDTLIKTIETLIGNIKSWFQKTGHSMN